MLYCSLSKALWVWISICKAITPVVVWSHWQTQVGHYACILSHVQLFAILWTVARQAPLSMGFSRVLANTFGPRLPPWFFALCYPSLLSDLCPRMYSFPISHSLFSLSFYSCFIPLLFHFHSELCSSPSWRWFPSQNVGLLAYHVLSVMWEVGNSNGMRETSHMSFSSSFVLALLKSSHEAHR